MGGEGAEGGALGWMSAGTFLFCRESGALLFSEDRSAYPQRLCYPCSLDLRPQHFLCFCFQELEKLGLGDSVDLHVYEIPVEYQTVQRLIPALWEKHSPQVPLRLHLLYFAVPESRPLSLRSCAPSGQAVQCRPAGPGTSGHH
uniref:Pyroglutamyl-peptidase I n=1 Tax=Ovis aries TaxID=9940 RepID=A0AC11D4J1_SHEEP